jgi:adenylate cyclase
LINPVLEVSAEDGLAIVPSSPSEDVNVELAFWDSIKDSGNLAELNAYLARYSDGPFAVLARSRRDALIAADESHAMPAKVDKDTLAVELAFWEAAKDSGSRIELGAYLERFPEGEFVELAKARLEGLREAETESLVAAPNEDVTEGELTFWHSIKDSGNPDMFRAYLNKYPNGTYAGLAQINIGFEGS